MMKVANKLQWMLNLSGKVVMETFIMEGITLIPHELSDSVTSLSKTGSWTILHYVSTDMIQ